MKTVITSGGGDTLDSRVDYTYTPDGRPATIARKQGRGNDVTTVTTTYTYDAMNRLVDVATNKIGANETTIHESNDYRQYVQRQLTHASSGRASTVITLDRLGRTIASSTGASTAANGVPGAPVRSLFAFDIAGNTVYESDGRDDGPIVLRAFDHAGRMTDMRDGSGSHQHIDYDSFGRATKLALGAGGNDFYTRDTTFTDAGMVQQVKEGGAFMAQRVTDNNWDGAGRMTRSSINGKRAVHTDFDEAGRLLSFARGKGGVSALSEKVQTSSGGYGATANAASTSTQERLARR